MNILDYYFIVYKSALGKAMANYPQELAQDAAYQSHTGRLTGLWFQPKLAQGLNTTTTTTTNNNNNSALVRVYISSFILTH